MPALFRHLMVTAGAAFALAGCATVREETVERPPEVVTYLLPAPREAIVFAPFVIAESRGYYAQQQVSVNFVTLAGGVKVGEALSRGEGDLGGAVGDTPVLLRNRGLAIKGVALLGDRSFLTLITRSPAPQARKNLKGSRLGVPSFTDVSFYALQGFLHAASVDPEQVDVVAQPPAQLWQDLGQGALDGIVGTVDWGVKAERSGAVLHYTPLDFHYPAMAQAIMASDDAIHRNPRRIRGFIRATLRAMADIRRNPESAAAEYRRAMPGAEMSDAEIRRTFELLGRHVYGGQRRPGTFDPSVVDRVQRDYLARNLISTIRRSDEFYTNALLR